VPLKFYVTSQPKSSGAHVYGGRSRFMTDKLMKCFDPVTFQGSSLGSANLAEGETAALDVRTRLKEMW
jgi:hypothetical protein